MTLDELIRLNFAWSGRDYILVLDHAENNQDLPEILTPIEAGMCYGSSTVLGFDGDLVYLK